MRKIEDMSGNRVMKKKSAHQDAPISVTDLTYHFVESKFPNRTRSPGTAQLLNVM